MGVREGVSENVPKRPKISIPTTHLEAYVSIGRTNRSSRGNVRFGDKFEGERAAGQGDNAEGSGQPGTCGYSARVSSPRSGGLWWIVPL